jgi:hypothetical protein
MEPEGSIPNSQELSTCPYPEPDQSSAHNRIPPVKDDEDDDDDDDYYYYYYY